MGRGVRTFGRVASVFSRSSGGENIMLIKFLQEEEGQTLVEYGMLISLIALVVIAAITLFGSRIAGMWGNNAEKFPEPPK